jgi:CubicO group peptidase (beta-lactamase class C family)
MRDKSYSQTRTSGYGSRYAVVDPEEVGVEKARLEELVERARREVDAGLLPSCQLALAKDGRLVLFETIGDADPSSRYVVYSVTKGIVAGAIWILVSEGLLDWDTRVADIVPGFRSRGKDAVSLEHLLTHTAGFPYAPMLPSDALDPKKRAETYFHWHLEWTPGERFEYHPLSAHWVLADVIEQLSGRNFRDFIHEEICEPLGLESFRLGEPIERQQDINKPRLVGEPPSRQEMQQVFGVDIDPAALRGPVSDEVLVEIAKPELLAIGMPGGGGISNAADIALYYQALLHNTGDIWDPEVIAEGVEPVCDLPDPIRKIPCHRSRGLMVAGTPPEAQLRGFGHGLSPRTFGHDGAGGQIAWADPESGISFCYLTDGLDRNFIRQARRSIGISSRAAAVCKGADD